MSAMLPFIEAISSSSSLRFMLPSPSTSASLSDIAEIYSPISLTPDSHLVPASFFALWIAEDIA